MTGQLTGALWSLWRAVTAYRAASALFCVFVIVRYHASYARPAVALTVAALIVAWTVVACTVGLRRRAHRLGFVLADVGVVLAMTLLSVPAETYSQLHGGRITLTSVWAAAPVLGAAVLGGWRAGIGCGLVLGSVSIAVRQGYDGRTLVNVFLLVLAGASVGYVTQLVREAEAELSTAAATRAAVAERERLARSIHDGVLQVLSLVARRGAELGGAAAELGRLAGEQEESLRALITSASSVPAGEVDVASALVALRSASVTVSVPGSELVLPGPVATELLGAVHAALSNVRHHAGPDAHTWVLLEDLGPETVVTVRDDGVGYRPGRLAEAAAQGRIGVRSSILGRMAESGGTVEMTSTPGEGTEVELRMPRTMR